jgi:hypothetical protein
VAGAQSKRQSRKRRRAAAAEKAPAAAARPRSAREAATRRPARQGALSTTLTGKRYGEPPPNPFGGVPVSELAILAGAIGLVVGLASKTALVVAVAVIVIALAVTEFSAREHLSGYRSHAALLAAVPATGLVVLSVAVFGAPSQRGARELMLAAAVPVFAVLFWFLRKRFRTARHARSTRPPAP